MILAAHQPSYLPWLGYLDKMAKADVFVVVDDIQYEAQAFENRNRVKVNNGVAWLTVPLEKGAHTDRICDKRIQNSGNAKGHWQRCHWLTLKTHYRRAPHFARYAEEIEYIYTRPWIRLIDLDLHVLELVRRWFGITSPVLLSSSLALEGQLTERILNMCQKLGADVYLSGSGGSVEYLDVELLRRHGVTVVWQHFTHPVYPQRYPELGFIPNLAFLDLLFHCGPDSQDILFGGGTR